MYDCITVNTIAYEWYNHLITSMYPSVFLMKKCIFNLVKDVDTYHDPKCPHPPKPATFRLPDSGTGNNHWVSLTNPQAPFRCSTVCGTNQRSILLSKICRLTEDLRINLHFFVVESMLADFFLSQWNAEWLLGMARSISVINITYLVQTT